MIHNFRHSLEYERSMAVRADAFYRDVLGVTSIKRFDKDTDDDMRMQREDVDVLIVRNGIEYRVSEKFREHDFPDMYVEVFSKYPHTPGWLQTGSPNAILYFFPSSVYWITHKSLYDFCVKKLFPAMKDSYYEDIFRSHRNIVTQKVLIDNRMVSVNIIQAHNRAGADWETIGLSVGFDVMEKYGVKLKRFELIQP
ncbi:MAG: hypothetical protein JXR27_12890 [Paludibacteraceae bacterium]|nr:hypothetical protein [Paludibacteraceae bacterium]